MDRKSKESETIYPDLFFSIDDFEQVKVTLVVVAVVTNGSSVLETSWYNTRVRKLPLNWLQKMRQVSTLFI